MPIEDRALAIGTRLVATYKGERFMATVVARGDAHGDKIAFRGDHGVGGGLEYKSLSELGGKITGGSVNGWKFWSVEGQEPVAKTKAERAPRQIRIGKTKIEARPPVYDEAASRERREASANKLCALGDHPLNGPAPEMEYHQKRDASGRIIDICCACAHPETLKQPAPAVGRKPGLVKVRKLSSIGTSAPPTDDGPRGLKELFNIGGATNPAISARVGALNKALAGATPTKKRNVRRAAKR